MASILELAGLHLEGESESGFRLNAVADVSGEKPADIIWTSDGGLAEGSHAKTRRREEKEEGGFP
jgi:hypothetical protein